MFLLVPAYPGCPGSKAVKRSLLLLFQHKICYIHSCLLYMLNVELFDVKCYVLEILLSRFNVKVFIGVYCVFIE